MKQAAYLIVDGTVKHVGIILRENFQLNKQLLEERYGGELKVISTFQKDVTQFVLPIQVALIKGDTEFLDKCTNGEFCEAPRLKVARRAVKGLPPVKSNYFVTWQYDDVCGWLPVPEVNRTLTTIGDGYGR